MDFIQACFQPNFRKIMINEGKEFTEDEFSQYLNIDSLKAELEKLRNTDFTDKSPKEILKIFNDYFDLMPTVTARYTTAKFNTFKFYRVRNNVNLDTEDLNLIQTYSYPLPQFCKENGRANLKNMSVFYCSNHALTALIESKPKVGEIGYLSIWQGRAFEEMSAGVLLPKTLRKENVWSELTEDLYSHVEKNVNEKLKEKSSLFHEKLKFIANLFLTEVCPYPITSLVASELLYGKARKDFIIYPSFANDSYSCNMAIHPNVVDGFLKFKKVIRFKVLAISGQNFTMSTGRVGELVKNNIEWRTATQEELDFSLLPI